MSRRSVTLASAIVLGALLSAGPVGAECVMVPAKTILERASTELAFSGTVFSVTHTTPRAYRATFLVDRVWKGTIARRFDVYVADFDSERPHLAVDEHYVIFAERLSTARREAAGLSQDDPQAFTPVICGDLYGAGLENLRRTLGELGPGQPPRESDPTESRRDPSLTERIEEAIAAQEPAWQLLRGFGPRPAALRKANAQGHWMRGPDDLSVYLTVFGSSDAAAKFMASQPIVRSDESPRQPIDGIGDRAFRKTTNTTTEVAFQSRNIVVHVRAGRSAPSAAPDTTADRDDSSLRIARLVAHAIVGDVVVTACVNGLLPERRPSPRTPEEGLFRAVQAECIPEVQAALAAGASPHAHDGETTALAIAAYFTNVEIVRQLLKAGASPNARNSAGCTALCWLLAAPPPYTGEARARIVSDWLAIVDAFTAAGMDINARREGDSTLLLDALKTQWSDQAILEGLIARGADPRVRDGSGDTALTTLISQTPDEILATDKRVQVLIAVGVDLNARNARGDSALDLLRARAARSRYYDLGSTIQKLISAGAK